MKKRILSHGLLLALAVSSTASLLLAGCTKYVAPEEYNKTVVASYNGWDITLAEANYLAKSDQYHMEELYYYVLQSEPEWNSDYKEAVTVEDYHKNQIMSQLLQTALLCSKAEEYGVSLSSEDKEKIEKGVEARLGEIESNPFFVDNATATKETLTTVYTNNALANRVWEYLAKDIDTTVNEEEFLHKTCTFLLLKGIKQEAELKAGETPAESTEEASAGENGEGSEAEPLETDLVKVMADVEKEFEDGKSLEELKADLEARGYEAENSYATFGKDELEQYDFGATAFALSEGEHATYDAGEGGVYLLSCIDGDNEQEKQKAIEEELGKRRTALFEEKYKELTETAEPYTVDERIWKGIRFDEVLFMTPTPLPTPTPTPETQSAESTEEVSEEK